LTIQAALAVIGRVLAGNTPAGFQTPAMAYGPDFVLELAGVCREDAPEVSATHAAAPFAQRH
jgi:hypothetical protein